MPLADLQMHMRNAIVAGELAPLVPVLVGGRDPVARFAIHRRHYEASLVRALTEKFPAVVWLAGTPFVTAAAGAYVRAHPPSAPCIAEYGADFPIFLAGLPEARGLPWLCSVGELEWHLGRAAVAVEHAPLSADALSRIEAARLADCSLRLQPGLHYFAAQWPVDELVALFLSEQAPDRYALEAQAVHLEIHGARGSFSMTRLDTATFAFRQTLARGSAIGAAADQALDVDEGFDAGQALLQAFAAGLVTDAIDPDQGASP